jgi:hypothetical protein
MGSLGISLQKLHMTQNDICKKGHRKNKYLFSFPGLVLCLDLFKTTLCYIEVLYR